MEDNIEVRYMRLEERRNIIKRSIRERKESIRVTSKELKKLTLLSYLFSSVLTSLRRTVIKELRTIVTPVIKHVFIDENFSFDIQYKQSGNNHYYTPIIRDGTKIRIPKSDSGGGIIPILDFTLRVAFLELGSKKVEKVLFLDEPFGGLGLLSYRTADIISKLSKRLGIQFIINTHDFSIAETADKKWKVTKRNGRSYVKELTS